MIKVVEVGRSMVWLCQVVTVSSHRWRMTWFPIRITNVELRKQQNPSSFHDFLEICWQLLYFSRNQEREQKFRWNFRVYLRYSQKLSFRITIFTNLFPFSFTFLNFLNYEIHFSKHKQRLGCNWSTNPNVASNFRLFRTVCYLSFRTQVSWWILLAGFFFSRNRLIRV